MEYTSIKSKYLRKKIKLTKWENRDYINDLIRLEQWALHWPKGFSANLHFHNLKSEYEEEYIAILRELNPERLKVFLAELKLNEKKYKKVKGQFKKELAQEKKDWLKAGGKP